MTGLLKQLHVTLAILTALSFSFRGLLMLRGSDLLHARWLRVAPHIIDTLLLASGLALAVLLYHAFYYQAWLLAKLAAIVVYILLGTVALKRGRSKGVRSLALLASLAVLAYIFAVAITRSPAPFA
jgi:uncharacterized membrane protein SirB2